MSATKTFNKRFNAQRAARSALKNPTAQEGKDFATVKTAAGWTFREPKTEAKSIPRRAHKAVDGGSKRGESKVATLIARAKSPAGITNAEMRDATGWTKLGGFFTAVKRAGLKLERVRENGDTRWFAKAA